MTHPRLSIIIPTFKAEKTLGASLDSVFSQDFGDWELLIMDGGSADDTLTIAAAAAEKDPRIRVLSGPDKGVYDAMNKGIVEARGEWLFFLGSDDFLYDAHVLSAVFARPDVDDVDFLYGNVVSPSYSGIYDGAFDLPKLLRRNISHQAIFYRRTLFCRIPAYNLRYKGYADWDLNIRLFLDAGVRIRYIGGTIARFGPGGLSSRHDVPFLQEVLFPKWLWLLSQTGLRAMRSVTVYDEWWRLLRNAEFADRLTMEEHAGASFNTGSNGSNNAGRKALIPRPVAQMAAWQEKIPRRVLKAGICSKILMFASYSRHLLTGAL